MIFKEDASVKNNKEFTNFSNTGYEDNNVNSELAEKVKTEKDYKLIDILDDLFASNRALMLRRRRKQFLMEEKLLEVDTAVDDIMKQKYPNGASTDDEKEAMEADRLKIDAIERDAALADLDLDYELVGNLLVIGEPGGGKTSIIEQWAEDNHIGLVVITGSDVDENVTKGTPFRMKVKKPGLKPTDDPDDEKNQVDVCAMLPSEFFAQLDNPDYRYTVLFVDEINRAWSEAMGALLTLVLDRTILDRNWNLGRHKFDKFLFTIAALNPPTYDPNLKDKSGKPVGGIVKNGANSEAKLLPNALNTRFTVFYWNSDPEETKKFIDKTLDKFIKGDSEWLDRITNDPNFATNYDEEEWGSATEIKDLVELAKSWKEIADTLLGNGNFKFADKDEIDNASKGNPRDLHVLNARTLTTALLHCDGTIGLPATNGNYPPKSFMYRFKHTCSQDPKVLKKAEAMLKPLVNLRLNGGTTTGAAALENNLKIIYDEWKETFGAQYGL